MPDRTFMLIAMSFSTLGVFQVQANKNREKGYDNSDSVVSVQFEITKFEFPSSYSPNSYHRLVSSDYIMQRRCS